MESPTYTHDPPSQSPNHSDSPASSQLLPQNSSSPAATTVPPSSPPNFVQQFSNSPPSTSSSIPSTPDSSPSVPHDTSSPSSHSEYIPSGALSTPSPTHSLTIRSKTVARHLALLTHVEPSTMKQALTSPHWFKAMQLEYNALLTNNSWQLVPLPHGRQAIGCKWVFKIKENPYAIITKPEINFAVNRV